MSTPNPNTPPAPTPEDVEKLTKALEAERAEHKATKEAARGFRARVASGFGLGEDADDETITARLTDSEAALAARTAALTKERDEANARAADVEARWAGEKVDAALREAFAKSGAREEHYEDFRNLAGALFHVDPKTGRVVTKPDAPNTVPGSEPLAWIHAELKSRRAFWWPGNVSGNARGGGIGANPHGDDSCFRPGPTWNLTAQFAYEGKYGSIAADTARRRYGGGR